MSTKDLAKRLAKGILSAGDMGSDRVQRIQFKGGSWPDHETNLGGLNEAGLTSVIWRLLESSGSGDGKP